MLIISMIATLLHILIINIDSYINTHTHYVRRMYRTNILIIIHQPVTAPNNSTPVLITKLSLLRQEGS